MTFYYATHDQQNDWREHIANGFERVKQSMCARNPMEIMNSRCCSLHFAARKQTQFYAILNCVDRRELHTGCSTTDYSPTNPEHISSCAVFAETP